MEKMRFELVEQDYGMHLANVSGVVVDSRDRVVISVRGVTPVIVFDKYGKYLDSFGTELMMKNPHGICVDASDNIYVVDGGRHVVFKFSPEGKLLMTLGNLDRPSDSGVINRDFKTIKRGAGPFNAPGKVAVRKSNGHIYVADGYGNTRVHHFDADGKLLQSWGEPGHGPGEFYIVHGIGVDNETGEIYVCDRENERIQIFDENGKYLRSWDRLYRPTDVHIVGDRVYVCEIGMILFTDTIFYPVGSKRHWSQVRVFDRAYNELAVIGTENCGAPGSFFSAHGVGSDSDGDIYICEVAWPASEIITAWPIDKGIYPPSQTHPYLQKFRKV